MLAARLPPLAGPDPDRARETILAMAGARAQGIGAQTALALGRPGALDALPRSRAPVLVLTGGADRASPEDLGRMAAAAAPNGRFRLLPGLGHYALAEDPAACARALREMEQADS